MIDDTKIEYFVKFFDGGSLKKLKIQLANAEKAVAKFEQRTKDANSEVVKLLNLQELASKQGFSSNVKIDRAGNQLIAGGGAEAERKAAIDRGIIAKRNVQEAERILKLSKDARLRLNSHYTELDKQQAIALTTLTRQEFANREVLNLKQAQVKLEAAKLRAGQAARAFASAPNGQGPVRNTASVNLANSQLDVAAAEKQVATMKQLEAASKRVATQQVKINSALDRANILRREGNVVGARKELQNARIAKAKAFELNQERLTSAELSQQVRLNESIARAKARASKATNPLDSLNRRLEDGGAGLLKIQAQLLANYAAMGLAFRALAFAGRFVVELDKEFAQLQAITATTDESMGKLEKTIISVSEGVKFTALEVAEAATIMGQAGFSVNQITSSIGDITLLATAVGTDLNTAVDLVTSTISVFNLRAEEAGTIANVFTTAVNNSKLNLEKLTLGLQYAGNIANEQNITFSELTATLGAMANSGIRSGSTLGTGLRQILTALAAPSEKLTTRLTELGLSTDDVNVKLHGLTGVLSNLQEAGFTTSDALQVLEVRAGAAYAALTNRSSTIDDLRQEFLFSSAAAEANSVQMEALANKGARLQSVFGTLVAKGFEPLLDVTKGATDLLSAMLSVLNRLGPVLPILVTLLTSYTAAVVANRVAITALNLAGQKHRAEMLKTATATRIAQGGYKGLLGAMGPVGLGLVALTTAFALAKVGIDFFTTSTDELKSKFDEVSSKLATYEDNMRSLDKEIEILSKRHFEASESMQEVNNIAFELQQKFADLGSQFELTGGDASRLIPELQRLKNELREMESIDLASSLNALSELQLKQNKESAFTNKFSSRSVDSLINQVGFNTKRFTRDGAREQFGLPSSITSLNDKDNLAGADITTLLKAQQDLNKVKARGLKLQQEFAGKEIKFLDTETKQVKYFVDQYLEQVSRIEDRLSLTLDGRTKERSLENREKLNAFQQTPVFTQLESKIPALDAEIQGAKNDGNLDELRPIFIKAIDKIAEQLTTNELFKRTSLSSDLEAIRSDLEKSTEETKGELKAREALALAVTKSKEVQLRELKRTTTIENSVSEISTNRAKALKLFDAQSKAELSSLQAKLKKEDVSGPTITKTLEAKEKELAEQRITLQNKFSRLVLERENKIRDDYLSNLTSSFKRRIELQKALVDRNNSVAEIEAARKEAFRLQGEKEIYERQQLANKYFNDESARILNNAELNVKFKTERQALNRAFSSITDDIEDKHAPNLSNALKELTKTFTDAQKVLEQRLKDLENPVRDAETTRRSFDARSNRGRFGSVSRDLADKDIEDVRVEALESQIKLLGETSRSEIAEQRQKLQEFEAVLLGRITTLQDRINDPNTSVAQIAADKKELVQLESQKLNVESELEGVELLDTQTLEQAKDKLREISEITGQGAPAARSWSQAWAEGLDAYIQKLDEATISSDNFADTVLEVGSLATDSLGEAFFDIATGAKSVGEAFGDMAEAILKAILKILAEQAAIFAIKQIFGVFGFTPQTFSGGGAIRGFSGGGRIPNLGVTGRDHVPIMAEAGEFMLRKSAVDSIGKDKLYAMNALGRAALKPDTVQSIAIPESIGGNKEVNVYVVSPEEKLQLGPDDIIHIIGEDIATGGQTKQLVKHAMMN